MPAGVRTLLLLTVPVARKPLEREVTNAVRLSIARLGAKSIDSFVDDSIVAAADALIADAGGPPWTEEGFTTLRDRARRSLATEAAATVRAAGDVVVAADQAQGRLGRLVTPSVRPSVDDARAHLARLVRPGFITVSGAWRLPDVLRYVRAIDRRAERLPEDPARDQRWMRDVRIVEQRYRADLARLAPSQVTPAVLDVGWMIEELRVSLFAQALGTPVSVSVQRINRMIDQLEADSSVTT